VTSHPHKWNVRRAPGFRSFVTTLIVSLAATALALSAALPARAVERSSRSALPAPKPGSWITLGPSQGGTTATLLHVASGNDLVVWEAPVVGAKQHYEAVELKPKGGLASQPTDVFGGQDWGGLDETPTLASEGGQPLLILQGTRSDLSTDPYRSGCIVGDLRTSSGWQLQSWSLSANCFAGHFGATITQSGTLSAAWPGGWANGYGIRYRIGTSSTIPATPDDQHLSSGPGDNLAAAEATETGSQDVYAAWARSFSNPASLDGTWAADLSKGSAPVQAPGSGTNVVAHQYEPVAMASPSGRGGIYLAYPNNVWPFTKIELWRYGARTAATVPGSASPTSVSISPGPAGRLWIAWWSGANGTVRVVRTNEADNRFGPVETHAGPHGCKSDGSGTIRISSGSQQRLDVIMSCYDNLAAHGADHASATQSIVPLQIAATTVSINRRVGGSVTYRVSDVGDAVPGATVTVDGRRGKTNQAGRVTFRFAKGSGTGSFKVVASMTNYLKASTVLRIG